VREQECEGDVTKDARNKKQECKAETKNGGNDRNTSKE